MSKVWRVKSPKLSDKFFIAFAFVYFLSSTYQAVHQQKFISNWNLQEPLMSRFMLIIFRLGESSSNPMATKNVVHGVIFKSTTRVHLRLISVWSSRAHRNIKLCRRLNAQSMERVCLFLKALGDKKNATCGRSHERKKWRKKINAVPLFLGFLASRVSVAMRESPNEVAKRKIKTKSKLIKRLYSVWTLRD